MKLPNQEAQEILAEKLEALRRLRQGLLFTDSRLNWPVANTQECDSETLERLSAFTERFAKLQDILAGAMRHALLLRGENLITFGDVLSVMEKLAIVDDQQEWIQIRLLRNKAAHDYTTNGEHLASLIQITDRFLAWAGS